MDIEIQLLPGERALTNANNGTNDGDVSRIVGLDEEYPNLMRVPEVIMRYEHVVFTRAVDAKVTGPEDLRPYDVGVVKGWKIVEWNTTKARSVTLVDESKQLFKMLDDGRIDMAILERMTGLMQVKALGIKGIHVLEPPFLAGDWFLYLNKKHQDLVPRFAAEIRRMKEDGTHERIFRSVLTQFSH
ncbi:Extracellular solute-binding protein family 3 (fragment) [Candidatus Terasakiella magnetica]